MMRRRSPVFPALLVTLGLGVAADASAQCGVVGSFPGYPLERSGRSWTSVQRGEDLLSSGFRTFTT